MTKILLEHFGMIPTKKNLLEWQIKDLELKINMCKSGKIDVTDVSKIQKKLMKLKNELIEAQKIKKVS